MREDHEEGRNHGDLLSADADANYATERLGYRASIVRSRLVQEIEHARIHDSTLTETHVVAGLWHQFDLDVRKETSSPSQGRCRVVDHLAVAYQQQCRDTHRPQSV